MRRPDNVLEGLGAPLRALLARAAACAQQQGAALWLVGGVVRDLLLGQPVERDVDLAVEGDVVALAQVLAQTLGGRIVATHAAFGTATVELGAATVESGEQPGAAPITLDLARTRTETYAHPAALPLVQPAGIAADLQRRDFSVNAIALPLNVDPTRGDLRPAPLLDPFNGVGDLAGGLLRVLHDASFDDDPTRILRGLRLAARLGLRPDVHTQALLDTALARRCLEATSPDRVRGELCLALAEPQPDAVLRLADAWGVTAHLVEGLRWSGHVAERCARLSGAPVAVAQPLIYAGLLTYDLDDAQREAVAARYRLPGDAARLLRELGAAKAALAQITPQLRPSALDRLLQPFGVATLLVVYYAEASPVAAMLPHYLAAVRPLMPALDGHALQALGVAPGPGLGRLLRALRAARLDGEVATREDEEAWVKTRIATSTG